MDSNEVKRHIMSGKFDPYYLFVANEPYVTKTYINKIAQKSKGKLEYVDHVSDIQTRATSKTLFRNKSVFVVIDDKDFMSSDREEKWDKDLSRIRDDILILEFTTMDKRVKFWKHFQNRAVVFDKMDKRLLRNQINKRVKMKDSEADLLIEACDYDLGRILLELEKLQLLGKSASELIKQKVIYKEPKDALFDFVNAVLDRKPKLALSLLEECKAVGEADMVMISVLYSSFRNVLQVQTCSSDNISKTTGLTGWQIKNAKPYINRYSDDELVTALKLLRETEKNIKTGGIESGLSTLYAILCIL